MSLSFNIARRLYLTPDESKKVSNPAIKIAMAGIAIGIAVMIISVAVVFGFKHTIKDKVVGFGSHITVGNFLSMHGYEQAPVIMGDSMLTAIKKIEGVKSASPYAVTQGILKTDNDFLGIQIKGVGEDYDCEFIKANVIEGRLPKFSKTTQSKELLVSKIQADKLQL
ncbi:MAG: ABC transporter permease, partial [Prevotella sp.]|nr:ABC transporter permease [Prevotella sp.]